MQGTRTLPRGAAATLVMTLVLAACGQGSSSTDLAGSSDPSTSTGTAAPGASSNPATLPPSMPATAPPTHAAAPTATAAAPPGIAFPIAQLTPGETFAGVTAAQVCTPGYAGRVRRPTLEQYHEVYGAYGVPYPEPSGTYELDHLIPLELGGDSADANLWPEPASPRPGFHQKDALENTLHALVCSGRLDLHQAQREIAANWYAAYLKYAGG